MFKKSVIPVLLVAALVLIFTGSLAQAGLETENQCEWQFQSQCGQKDQCDTCTSSGWRDGIMAARQDIAFDFTAGVLVGPFAFAPDVLSVICGQNASLSYCRSGKVPNWRLKKIKHRSVSYRRDYKES